MANSRDIPLTVMEVGILWNQYILDTLSMCVERFALKCEKDDQIRAIINDSLTMLESTTAQIRRIYQAEGVALPQGFGEEDVNLAAPPLFSSIFRLRYLKYKLDFRLGMNGLYLARSTRADIRKMYQDITASTLSLEDRSTKLLLNRGIYVRSPHIVLDQERLVQQPSFMGRFFGTGERKMLALEIGNMFFHIQNNMLGKTLLVGFAQATESPVIRDYIVRGIGIADKQVNIFSDFLRREDISVPSSWDLGVTSSTVAPFSERLIMQHIALLCQTGLVSYGHAISETLRKDIITDYVRLSSEIGDYLADGTNIMLDNDWLEQPPQALDHMQLGLRQ